MTYQHIPMTQKHFDAAFKRHGYGCDLITVMNTCALIAVDEANAQPEPTFKEIDLAGAIGRMSEPVDPHAALREEYQKQVAEGTTGFYLWEFSRTGRNLWGKIVFGFDEFYDYNEYRYTDISCMVSKDGEPAIRTLKEDAKKLFQSTKESHAWFYPKCKSSVCRAELNFNCKGIYTYRTKATTLK